MRSSFTIAALGVLAQGAMALPGPIVTTPPVLPGDVKSCSSYKTTWTGPPFICDIVCPQVLTPCAPGQQPYSAVATSTVGCTVDLYHGGCACPTCGSSGGRIPLLADRAPQPTTTQPRAEQRACKEPLATTTSPASGFCVCDFVCLPPTATYGPSELPFSPIATITKDCTVTLERAHCGCDTCATTTACSAYATTTVDHGMVCDIACRKPQSTCTSGELPWKPVATETVGCEVELLRGPCNCPTCQAMPLPTPGPKTA